MNMNMALLFLGALHVGSMRTNELCPQDPMSAERLCRQPLPYQNAQPHPPFTIKPRSQATSTLRFVV